MRTITRKEIKKLVTLANRSARAAMVHDNAQKKFMNLFESILGEPLDFSDQITGSDDRLVDVIDFGHNFTDEEDMIEMINNIIDDNKTFKGNFLIE
jgi:putative heme iron utilization protein